MNTRFDALAYANRLRYLPPWQKLGFATAALGIAFISHPPVQMAIFCWLSVWIVRYAGIPIRTYQSMLLGMMMFLIASLPVLLITVGPVGSAGADALSSLKFFNWQISLSHQGISQVATLVCRAIASSACLFFIVLTTPVVELTAIFNRLGFPSILSELLLLTYRFIFLLAETVERLILAQTARSGYRTPKLTMNSVSLLIRQLLQRTVERYHQLALGIQARGFNHAFRFWHPQPYQFSWRYGLEAITGCVALVGWEGLVRIYG